MTGTVVVQRVIAGVDFDGPSAAAMRVASAVADAFGVPLVAAHAATTDVPAYFTQGQVAGLEAEVQERRVWLAEQARAFAASHGATVSDVLVEDGPAAAALVRLSRPGDLLVVGTHRLRGPHRWWLGSVAEAVVREAVTPVLVVPSGDGEAQELRPGGSILVPSSTADPRVEAWVTALAQALVAQVQRTDSVATCPAALIRQSELIVVPLTSTASKDPSFEHVVHVLKECTHPVLFIPPASGEASFKETDHDR